MKKVFDKKTPVEIAEEIYRRDVGLSGSELSDLVTKVMKENRDDPQDEKLRSEIGRIFKELRRRIA